MSFTETHEEAEEDVNIFFTVSSLIRTKAEPNSGIF